MPNGVALLLEKGFPILLLEKGFPTLLLGNDPKDMNQKKKKKRKPTYQQVESKIQQKGWKYTAGYSRRQSLKEWIWNKETEMSLGQLYTL
jgi:hypothetical protein